MLQMESVIRGSDNSGAKLLRVIKTGTQTNQLTLKGCKIITVSVKYSTSKRKLIKRCVYKSIIISTKKSIVRKDGSYVKFDKNRAIPLTDQYKLIGTRVYGCACKEVKKYRSILPDSITLIKGFI